MTGKQWTSDELETFKQLYKSGMKIDHIAERMKKSSNAVWSIYYRLKQSGEISRKPISASSARQWLDHLTVTGDALVIPDLEIPYHNHDFVNRCIDLALDWGIDQVILAGDAVHFANFSSWGADFQPSALPAAADQAIMSLVDLLPAEKRGEALELLQKAKLAGPDDGISAEMAGVRQGVKELEGAFDRIYYIMGNHEHRKLRNQEYGENPEELLRFINADVSKWSVTPFYWCKLETSNKYLYRIEHPKPAGRTMAQDLAVQYQEHIIAGHSHRWALNRDPSGRLYAIQAGHCVDETRLAYVMQRSAKRDAHALGAVIVRDGYPYLLEENTPWGRLKSQNCK